MIDLVFGSMQLGSYGSASPASVKLVVSAVLLLLLLLVNLTLVTPILEVVLTGQFADVRILLPV